MRLVPVVFSLLFSAVSSGANAEGMIVLAAASLKDALDEAVRTFDANTGQNTKVSYGASSALARQIERGAPADLFLSADVEWMDYLAGRKLIRTETRVDLLTNRLVLISPAASNVTMQIAPGFPLAAALGNGRLAMADPDYVPAGKYGRAALQSMGVWTSVSTKIAPSEDVRAALRLVARGETPLGIVYRTDALAERKVRIVAEFPATSHPLIVYPAAVTAVSKSAAASRLLDFLRSPAARAIWIRHGFGRAN
ncbi:MAG TPA: molybdate ABC transporter substrate-binding protein [Burkholderiales bacterium]|nr:molybdate ABC transporter substrate-binding protein [Burkholderiales bacterium]